MSGFGTDKSTSEKMSKPGFPCTSEDDPKTRGSTIYLQAYEVPYVPRRMSVEEHEESLWFQNLIKRERNPDGPNSSKALFESAKSSSSPWIRLAQSELSRGLL